MKKEIIQVQAITTFKKDKRMPINQLYYALSKLDDKYWNKEIITTQKFAQKRKKYELNIIGCKTKRKGNALWLIAGIHGEEPAGPNALAKNILFLNKIAKKIPIVLLPLCNPAGYVRDWRYVNLKRASRTIEAISVGDSNHLLPDIKNKNKTKKDNPTCNEAKYICEFILKNIKKYPPVLVIDFHEDESKRKTYIYSQGILGAQDPIAKEIVLLLKRRGIDLYEKGETRFDESIHQGIVGNVKDYSIDEFLAAKKIILNGKIEKGPNALSVITVETTISHIPLSRRIRVHEEVLQRAEEFFTHTKKIHKR